MPRNELVGDNFSIRPECYYGMRYHILTRKKIQQDLLQTTFEYTTALMIISKAVHWGRSLCTRAMLPDESPNLCSFASK